MVSSESRTYSIRPESDDLVVVTEPSGEERRIHRGDADPEHRFVSYRIAAGWFGNLPAEHTAR